MPWEQGPANFGVDDVLALMVLLPMMVLFVLCLVIASFAMCVLVLL